MTFRQETQNRSTTMNCHHIYVYCIIVITTRELKLKVTRPRQSVSQSPRKPRKLWLCQRRQPLPSSRRRPVPEEAPSALHLLSIMTPAPEQREWLKDQIKVKMKREPNVTLKAIKAWIKEDTSQDWNTIKRTTFHQFVQSNMEKFRAQGNLKRKPGSGEGDEISLRKIQQIKKLSLKKRFRISGFVDPGLLQQGFE